MNLLSTMLLTWAGLCAISVLAAALMAIAEIRTTEPDPADAREMSMGLHP